MTREHGPGFCPKVPHTGGGHLHDERDDAPYWVDGLPYCGRCHRWMADEGNGEREHQKAEGREGSDG